MENNENLDRVRANTSDEINARLDREMRARLDYYKTADNWEIEQRIEELEREWDIERVLEANAASLALAGLTLGVAHSKKWLFVPFVVGSFLLQHAVQGWCPPVPVFRRLGVRTRREIDEEKYALKVFRGDFDAVSKTGGSTETVLNAVRA